MNLLVTAREMAIIGIMGAGMTMVIITSGIDLSVASVLAFSAAVMGQLMMADVNIGVCVAAALIVGSILGAGNALLINLLKVPPIITTLGTMGILRAGTTLYTGAKYIGPLPLGFGFVGVGYTPIILLAVTAGVSAAFMLCTRTGRYVYAVGGNEEAVRLSGISVSRVKFLIYTINGLLASVAGLVLASSLSSVQSNTAQGYELNVIAAVVIGGTSIAGGQGSILGTVIGAGVIAVLSNALILLNIPQAWHLVTVGAVVLTAVLFDRARAIRNR
jgi:ribose transport system permease protein